MVLHCHPNVLLDPEERSYGAIPGESVEVSPPIEMRWGQQSLPTDAKQVSPTIDMCWGSGHGAAIGRNEVPLIDMCWGIDSTEPLMFDIHRGHPPTRGTPIPAEAVNAPLIRENVNKGINMQWGKCRSDIHSGIALTHCWGIGSTDSTKPSTINMHRGEDQPEQGAAVHANAPLIGEDLNGDINMHLGEHRFDIHDRLVTHATEAVDSSDCQEIVPTDYTGIENVGADGGQLETESLPSAEQSDSQDQAAVLLAKARYTLDMAVDLLTQYQRLQSAR